MVATTDRRDQRTLWAAISVLLAVGMLASILMGERARHVALVDASVRARNIVQQQISPLLLPEDSQGPAVGDRYRDLSVSVGAVLAGSPVQGIRLWKPDGTITFSDDRTLVGRQFLSMSEHLRAVVEGGVLSIGSGSALQTFIPVRIRGENAYTVVAQLDQPWEPIGSAGDRPWRPITIGLGLLLLLSIGVLLLTFRPVRPPTVVIADSRTWTPKDPREDEMMAARAKDQESANAPARAASSDGGPAYVHPGYRAEAEARTQAEEKARALEENYRVAQSELKKALERIRDLEAADPSASGAQVPQGAPVDPGHVEELRKTRGILREAEDRFKRSEAERHALEKKLAELEAAVPAASEADTTPSRRVKAAESELAKTKQRLLSLESELAKTAKRVTEADELRAKTEDRARSAEDRLARVQGELAQAQDVLTRSEQWGKAAEVELERASEHVAQMDERVRTAEQRLEEMYDRAQSAESRLEAADVELKSAEERMREMDEAATAEAKERESLLEQLAALNEQLRMAATRASQTEEKLEELVTRPAAEDLSAAEQRASAAEGELAAASERVLRIEEELVATKDRARDSNEQLAQLQSRLDEADGIAGRLTEELETLRAAEAAPGGTRSDLEDVLRITQERLAGSTEHLLQAEERARLAEREVKRVEAALEESKEEMRLLQSNQTLQSLSGDGDAQGEGEPVRTELPDPLVEDRRAAGPFLAALSLEARNSLASILGIALTLKHKKPSKDQAPLLRQLATQTRKLDNVVGDLLDADRLARGVAELKRRRTDLDALTRRVLDDSGIPKERHVEVHTEQVIAPVDPIRVEQILSAMLQMCFNRTSSGSHIWVRLWPTEEGAVLAVEDELPVTKDIALSPVVTTFAEMHGGWTKVAERPGGGSSFRVFLPETPGDGPPPAIMLAQDGIVVAPENLAGDPVESSGVLPVDEDDPSVLLRELGSVSRES